MYSWQTKLDGVKQLTDSRDISKEEAWGIIEELDRKHTIEIKKRITKTANQLTKLTPKANKVRHDGLL